MTDTALNKTNKIWTIGHSTKPIIEFIQLLQSFNIKCLVDIRSFPGSKYCPQFNKGELQLALETEGICYLHSPDLGGRRKSISNSPHIAWKNAAFKGYADYMDTDDFKKAITVLEDIALKQTTTYMCSEAVWWRCHRSLVSDYLKLQDWQVFHIMGINKATEHSYSKPANIVNDKLVYSKTEEGLLEL